MTTNERLFEAGIMDQFYRAGHLRDRTTMIELLNRVISSDLNSADVPRMVDDMLLRWELFFAHAGPAATGKR